MNTIILKPITEDLFPYINKFQNYIYKKKYKENLEIKLNTYYAKNINLGIIASDNKNNIVSTYFVYPLLIFFSASLLKNVGI